MRPPGGHDDIPSPGALATPAERAEAESFAHLIDRLVSEQELPPVLPSDERILVEVAAVVRACTGKPRLDESRQHALIDDALARALSPGPRLSLSDADTGPQTSATAQTPAPPSRTIPAGHAGRDPKGSNEPGTRRRERFQRVLPWAVAAVSAAAALLLALRSPRLPMPNPREDPTESSTGVPAAPPVETSHLQPMHRSRPADSLIGEIPRPRAAAASDRIDVIFADRLIGYRDLRLRGGRP
jgi:hypothetical protein